MAQINWTKLANEDIQNIIEFLSSQSEPLAKIVVQKMVSKIDLLEFFPNLGRLVLELDYKNVREIIVSNYRVVYHIVSNDRIDILRIYHSARAITIKDI